VKAKQTSLITSGLSFLDDGIAFTLISHEHSTPSILHSEFIACSSNEFDAVLAKLSKQHSLDIHRCNFVLQPTEYQILLVEKPDVSNEELTSAIKWRIKDLIDFNIDDTVIELLSSSFENQNSNTIEVVVTKTSKIQRIVNLLRSANINLSSIDIAELAARNIGHQLKPDLGSYALLNLWENTSRISVYLNNDLYLSRISSIGLNTLGHVSEDEESSINIIDTMALELQRTYDYFESHSRQAPISELFIIKNAFSNADIAELIQQRTGVDTDVLDLSSLTTNNVEINEKCINALGAALRSEFE
jgi:MSHA biogenesis protein MshI